MLQLLNYNTDCTEVNIIPQKETPSEEGAGAGGYARKLTFGRLSKYSYQAEGL